MTGYTMNAELSYPGKASIVCVLWAIVAGCTVPQSVDPNSILSFAPPNESRLVIELYEYEDIDLGANWVGLNVDPGQAKLGRPVDELADSELVGADWTSHTFEYSAEVRSRYGDDTAVNMPNVAFVLKFDDQAIIVGSLIGEFMAAIIDYPVLVFDSFGDCPDKGLLLHLRPSHGADVITTYPGLSESTSREIGDYLASRPLGCVQ